MAVVIVVAIVVADFVLVYEEEMTTSEQKKEENVSKKSDKAKMSVKDKYKMWRQKFMFNLRKAGLEVEEVKNSLKYS